MLSVRAPVGPVNMAKEKCCIGRNLVALHSQKIIDKDYFYYYMKFFEMKLVRAGRSSTFNAIRKDGIKKIEISYPKSKSEQKELVSKIEVMLDYNKGMITQNTNISSNLLRFQKSVLSRIFKQE